MFSCHGFVRKRNGCHRDEQNAEIVCAILISSESKLKREVGTSTKFLALGRRLPPTPAGDPSQDVVL